MSKDSLANKINVLITTKPDFDSDEESQDTKAKLVEPCNETVTSDDELEVSKLRRQNASTLDEIGTRYIGKKISRKDVHSDDSMNDTESESEINDEDEEKSDSHLNKDTKMDLNDDSIDISQSEFDSDKQDDYNIDVDNLPHKPKDSIKTMSETFVRSEIEKGNCIRNQLKLWESFLEMRIKLQKCIVISNQMPQYDVHKKFRSNVDFMKSVNENKTNLALMIEKMLQLKDLLLKQYPETENLCIDSKRRKIDKNNEENVDMDSMNEEIFSDTENESENEKQSSIDNNTEEIDKLMLKKKRFKYHDYEKLLQNYHDSYKEYRNSVIKKWNDKTRIATSSLRKSSGHTTLKQIEFAMNDINKLRKRSQLKHSEYNVIGKDDDKRIQEYDVEIYDDDDFYHQLLRDLIEYKSLNETDPIQLSKQWIQLQNMRKKMKRKIDTRATKGRRIRYNIHNKLVNFMTPITIHDTWTDNAKNELYNSLFNRKSTEELK